ncbi:MAG: hypothetical protein ACR2QZ_07590 [Woeseiaceae bacterium]
MKKVLFALILVFPFGALADHIDVIEFKIKDGCSTEKYMAIVKDFNEKWGAKNGYQSEVFFPVQSNNLESVYWVGRSSSTAAFGAAFDQWVKDQTDKDSLGSKLGARFAECSENLGRRSYMTG